MVDGAKTAPANVYRSSAYLIYNLLLVNQLFTAAKYKLKCCVTYLHILSTIVYVILQQNSCLDFS